MTHHGDVPDYAGAHRAVTDELRARRVTGAGTPTEMATAILAACRWWDLHQQTGRLRADLDRARTRQTDLAAAILRVINATVEFAAEPSQQRADAIEAAACEAFDLAAHHRATQAAETAGEASGAGEAA